MIFFIQQIANKSQIPKLEKTSLVGSDATTTAESEAVIKEKTLEAHYDF